MTTERRAIVELHLRRLSMETVTILDEPALGWGIEYGMSTSHRPIWGEESRYRNLGNHASPTARYSIIRQGGKKTEMHGSMAGLEIHHSRIFRGFTVEFGLQNMNSE